MKKIWWVFALFLSIVLSVCMAIALYFFLYPLNYMEYIERYSLEYDIEKELICAVINVESGFDNNKTSSKGAKGLMQILPSTANDICVALGEENFDPYDAETSIRYGVYYLNYLRDIMGEDERTILASYNAGLGNVRQWLAEQKYSKDGVTIFTTPYKETNDYIAKVLRNKKVYYKRII